jgi:hypothetical protein
MSEFSFSSVPLNQEMDMVDINFIKAIRHQSTIPLTSTRIIVKSQSLSNEKKLIATISDEGNNLFNYSLYCETMYFSFRI